MRAFFESIEWSITLWDTLPDFVAYRGMAYQHGEMIRILKHYYNDKRVASLTYKHHPRWDFIPKRKCSTYS
jgi:hypothetical protein